MADGIKTSEQQPRKRAVLGKISLLVALAAIVLVVILLVLVSWLGSSGNATGDQPHKLRTFTNFISVAVPTAHAAGMFIALAGLLFESRGRFWSWLGMILNFLLLALYIVLYTILNKLASGD